MTKTVLDSSSSAVGRLELDLSGHNAPLVEAFLAQRDLHLLDPLRFVRSPGDLPGPGPQMDRTAIAGVLEEANQRLGHPRARELAQALARPQARVVATGQQPGVLGGPLYTLTKALAAVRWARELDGGVPVFWVATEDHDFAEVSQFALPTSEGLESYSLGEDTEPLRPVGPRVFGPEMETLWETLEPQFARSPELLAVLRTNFAPGQRLGDAFSRTLIALLGDDCPLLLDALEPGVKQLQEPLLQQIIADRHQVLEAYQKREAEISEAGYSHQVKPQPHASPLFAVKDNKRRRIVWPSEDEFELRGSGESAAPISDLFSMLTQDPLAIGPGALARPFIQDRLLGTSVVLLGPGEMSYFPQAAALYGQLGSGDPEFVPPAVALRPQSVLLTKTHADRLEALDLSFEELFSAAFDVDRRVAQAVGGDPLPAIQQQLSEILRPLGEQAVQLDSTLEKPWGKTLSQMERGLETFGKKLTAAVARRNNVDRRRLEDLATHLRPQGKPQERVLVAAFFAVRFGPRFAKAWLDQLELDPTRIRGVVL